MPSGVNDTIEGSSTRPCSSGMTRGSPVCSSTYATRLFVVPRSIPMILSMVGLALPCLVLERLAQIVDHGPEIGAGRQALLELRQCPRPLRRGRVIPRPRERTGEPGLLVVEARRESLALGRERLPRRIVELSGSRLGPGLGQGLLDLEHLLEQLRRRLGLHRRALLGLAPLLQPHEVFDPRERITQRAVCCVEPGRGFERAGLLLWRRRRMEIRMPPP